VTSIGMSTGWFDSSAQGSKELAFSREEYSARLQSLCIALERAGIDLLWMTSPEAVAWLHGLSLNWYKANSPVRYPQCYGTAVHVRSRRFIHFDNPTERPLLARFSVSEDNRWLPDRDGAPNLEFIIRELSTEGWLAGRVGVELWSYVPNPAISSMFTGAFRLHGCDVIDATQTVRGVRRCKSPAELTLMHRAMDICDTGHRAIRELYRPGMTELALFGAVTAAMAERGGEIPAVIPVFCSVPIVNGRPIAFGHQVAMQRTIERGHILVADLCGVLHRYHANAMRGFYVGEDPPSSLITRYRLAGKAFDTLEQHCKAGMTVREVIGIMRGYYEEVGLWSPTEGWGLGYELGLSFPPDWVGEFYFHLGDDKGLDRVFEPGMVTNFESLFDAALIDTIVWQPSGAKVISKTPRELLTLP
jgi:Xaa-Pro aminopeptidase